MLRDADNLASITKRTTHCLLILAKLVDPNATATVVSYEEGGSYSKNTEKTSRPAFSFPSSAEQGASAAAALARAMYADDDNDNVVMDDIVEDEDEDDVVMEENEGAADENPENDDETAEAYNDEDDEVIVEVDGDYVDLDDDEEVESDDQEEEEDEEEEEEGDEVVEAEEDDDVMVDVVRHFEQRLMDISDSDTLQADAEEGLALDRARSTSTGATEKDRSRTLIKACMQVLAVQHPPAAALHGSTTKRLRIKSASTRSLISPCAEQSLIKRVCNVVKPPRKPLDLKLFMRRAPTQEEFFRGSLTRNPIPLSTLTSTTDSSAASEPTVKDLREFIAKDLQMADSAEMIELLVANQILGVSLKLRVVQQVLWRNYLMDNSSARQASQPLFGLSVLFNSGTGEVSSAGRNITADTPASSLPPMVVTYRLVGVDGEATEDMVSSLEDPEAPSSSTSAEEQERLMEKEYGITSLVTEGRGISILLRSIEFDISDALRRIRRDDVARLSGRGDGSGSNPARKKFRQSPPCSGLTLLRHCAQLASNRKKLLEAHAPTFLLRLLLDVLNALDEASSRAAAGLEGGPTDEAHAVTNPTADVLQELIETLASDMSPELETALASSAEKASQGEEDAEEEASTLPLLLSSLRTIYLGPPMRKVIAKLLPFLTYGQASLSRELAANFVNHVKIDELGDLESGDKPATRASVFMDTFVQATISMPPSQVCSSLRTELKNCGYVENVVSFILRDIPLQPPPWSSALWSKGENVGGDKRECLEKAWRSYFLRTGLRTAFQMLSGLCNGHESTQSLVAGIKGRKSAKKGDATFLTACHWLEATSDNSSLRIDTNGMGLLAETLLDELGDGNDRVLKKVKALRKETRDRKKEIANETRSKTLVSMSSFGPLAASADQNENRSQAAAAGVVGNVARRVGAASLFFGLFRDQDGASAAEAASGGGRATRSRSPKKTDKSKPAWLAEMEAMEDETGLTCAVCQEGRTLLPSELLGLYVHVKKVTLPYNKGGGRGHLDGTALLTSLPQSLPDSLVNTNVDHEWFRLARIAADSLKNAPHAASTTATNSSQNRRSTHLITTVSAGNAIHCSCHAKARSADRNHPRAPKSKSSICTHCTVVPCADSICVLSAIGEWEGASLRNSRVACNAILPLVSSKSSTVSLIAVDMALSEHQTVISNHLGQRPKSMLWVVLHDVRLLLLRMAYGEALNADCGGGSLSSNAALMFYQLFMADMFANDAEHDAPETAQHARFLSAGFLAVSSILRAKDFDASGSSTAAALMRGVADSVPMAALCCILFNNASDEDPAVADKAGAPHPRRRWALHKEEFLRGLIACAGRRHALSIEDSGCVTTKSRASRIRSSSFTEWDLVDDERSSGESGAPSRRKTHSSMLGKKRGLPQIDDFAKALRPMITLYAILDQLSSDFVVIMNDEVVEASAARLAETIEACQRSRSIHDLLQRAKVTLDHEEIIEELQKGMVSA
jgi:hypothetical protein